MEGGGGEGKGEGRNAVGPAGAGPLIEGIEINYPAKSEDDIQEVAKKEFVASPSDFAEVASGHEIKTFDVPTNSASAVTNMVLQLVNHDRVGKCPAFVHKVININHLHSIDPSYNRVVEVEKNNKHKAVVVSEENDEFGKTACRIAENRKELYKCESQQAQKVVAFTGPSSSHVEVT
ncbi:hypothetical protein Tco_0783996 [Tanacetum coccineum]